MIPIIYKFVGITSDSMSFQNIDIHHELEIPIGEHVGAFGAIRRHDIHKGVDLYCDVGTPVYACEDGTVVDIRWFTGVHSGCPWWNDTQAITVASEIGNLVYGEIMIDEHWRFGDNVKAGDLLGNVVQVLKKNKGRPTSMLHFAMHHSSILSNSVWRLGKEQPIGLVDPTNYLIKIYERVKNERTIS